MTNKTHLFKTVYSKHNIFFLLNTQTYALQKKENIASVSGAEEQLLLNISWRLLIWFWLS